MGAFVGGGATDGAKEEEVERKGGCQHIHSLCQSPVVGVVPVHQYQQTTGSALTQGLIGRLSGGGGGIRRKGESRREEMGQDMKVISA